MIIGRKFPYDENTILMEIQHAYYNEAVGYLFFHPKRCFLEAARLLRVSNELIELLKEKESFDHRSLQEAHDLIAARFRFDHFKGGQMPIPFDNSENYLTLMRNEWSKFYYSEVRNIALYEYHITWEIINAVVYQHFEKGTEAEMRLNSMLRDRYSFIFERKPYQPPEEVN